MMNGMVPQDKMQDFSGRIYHESERLSNLVADIIQLPDWMRKMEKLCLNLLISVNLAKM